MTRLEDRPLPGPARALVDFGSGGDRREDLKELARWAQSPEPRVVVLAEEDPLHPDLRALGFEDAGPLRRYAAPTAPGWVRRALWSLFAPALKPPAGAVVTEEPAGVRVRCGERTAFARLEVPIEPGGQAVVRDWCAPPDDADLAGLLAREAARRAGELGAGRIAFETAHVRVGHGLVLGGLLPARPRTRVLIRDPQGRTGVPPAAGALGAMLPVLRLRSGPLSSRG